jgi:geranylgeranyl diphosphate synthase type II
VSVRDEGPARRVADLGGLVETTLERALADSRVEGLDELGSRRLIEAMRYSLCTPGKRLRPLLLLTSAEAIGVEPRELVPFAIGVEMMHAYSLIHDDLPAMDDDELRRGQPTNHVVYGDGMAILAGDGLLTEAFIAMLEPLEVDGRPLAARLQMRVVAEIGRAAGHAGMVGGQAADLLAEGMAPEEGLVQSIHRRKTGALIRASVRAGALLASAAAEELAALDVFASHFGLAFQIADDVKDEVAPPEVTGKHRGGDREASKITYPALFGLDGSRERCRTELDQAIASLSSFGPAAAALELLAHDSVAPAFADHGA